MLGKLWQERAPSESDGFDGSKQLHDNEASPSQQNRTSLHGVLKESKDSTYIDGEILEHLYVRKSLGRETM